MTISDYAAWYGAIIASSALIWQVCTYFLERGHIKLILEIDRKIISSSGEVGPYDKDKQYINIRVINKGKRPIRIKNVGFYELNPEKKTSLAVDAFQEHKNKLLDDTNPSEDFLCEQDGIRIQNIAYLIATDARGNNYKQHLHKPYFLWRLRKLIKLGY